jgi:hypothetical protein
MMKKFRISFKNYPVQCGYLYLLSHAVELT